MISYGGDHMKICHLDSWFFSALFFKLVDADLLKIFMCQIPRAVQYFSLLFFFLHPFPDPSLTTVIFTLSSKWASSYSGHTCVSLPFEYFAVFLKPNAEQVKNCLISRIRRWEQQWKEAEEHRVRGCGQAAVSTAQSQGNLEEVMGYASVLNLAVADLKGKKIKELLNAGFPSEVKPERERAREKAEPFFLHQCSNVREGFLQEKWLSPQMNAHTQLQCLTINLETHPAGDSPRGKCVEDAFVASFILEGDSMKGDGRGL